MIMYESLVTLLLEVFAKEKCLGPYDILSCDNSLFSYFHTSLQRHPNNKIEVSIRGRFYDSKTTCFSRFLFFQYNVIEFMLIFFFF